MVTRGKFGAVKDLDPERAAELYSRRSEYEISVLESVHDDAIARYLAKEDDSNLLKSEAQAFVDMAALYELDPAFALAVAQHETGKGRSKALREKNNAFGIQPQGEDGPIQKFDTVADSIKQFCKMIRVNYVDKYDQATIIDITDNPQNPEGHSYCGEHHDSVSRLDWIEGVTRYFNDIIGS
jgi:beta-N-acetylglucosaminidase